MADKMLRVAGRDDANVSKPIGIDVNGNLKMKDAEAVARVEDLIQENQTLQTKVDAVTTRLNETLDMQLTGSNEELNYKSFDPTSDIPAGGSVNLSVKASVGKVADIIHYGFRALAPSGATSGDHRVIVSIASSGAYDRILDLTAENSQNIVIARGMNRGSATTVIPSDLSQQIALSMGLAISDTVDLRFLYINNTDAIQPATGIDLTAVLSERSVNNA